MNDCAGLGDRAEGFTLTSRKTGESVRLGGVFSVTCRDAEGAVKWEDVAKNLVVDVGLEHILDILFVSATAQVDPWYVGLTDGTPTVAAADTMSSHAGWVEVTAYDEAARQAFVDVRTGQSVDNSASKAAFTIDTNSTTIGGAFLSSDSTKSGTTGTLLCVAAFTGGDKTADDNDTLSVQYTFTAADDGV